MYIRSDWIYGLFPEGFPCLLVPPPFPSAAMLHSPRAYGSYVRRSYHHSPIYRPPLFLFFPKITIVLAREAFFSSHALFPFIIHLLRSAVKSIHHHHQHCREKQQQAPPPPPLPTPLPASVYLFCVLRY